MENTSALTRYSVEGHCLDDNVFSYTVSLQMEDMKQWKIKALQALHYSLLIVFCSSQININDILGIC